ncbi:MAG: alpha/beta fold hydrolase, partial [Egibacteraceae bacterium]
EHDGRLRGRADRGRVRQDAPVFSGFELSRVQVGDVTLRVRTDRAAGRRTACPTLALWSARDELPRWFDVLAVWRRWAGQVSGHGIDAGHFLAEEAPDAVADALLDFLGAATDG